jgi:hypothetical protein
MGTRIARGCLVVVLLASAQALLLVPAPIHRVLSPSFLSRQPAKHPQALLAPSSGSGRGEGKEEELLGARLSRGDVQAVGPVQAPLSNTRAGLAALLLALAPTLAAILLLAAPSAWADDGAELAPPVLDQARTLTTKAQERIIRDLNAFEEESGYRILVLSEDPRKVNKTPKELKQLWGLPDPDAVVVLVRPGAGNILLFNYGENIKKLLPDRFFGELTGRLGNMYNVRDVGEDGVVEESVRLLETCLRREKGCFTVPGIGKDQYTATLASSLAGGVFFGFSALTSAQFVQKNAKGEDAIFKFAPVLFFPLWGLFFIGLGLNPLLQREAEVQLIAQNVGAFAASASATGFIYPKMLNIWSGFM